MIGIYVNDTQLQEWYVNNLPNARSAIASYPNLVKIFNNFQDYEKKAYRKEMRNLVLLRVLPPVGGKRSEAGDPFLSELDTLIKNFGIINQSSEELKALISRLTDDDYFVSLSAYTELIVAGKFSEKIGLNNTSLFPSLSNNKKSDILLQMNSKKIFVEVTNLTERESQRKIQSIIDRVAEYIGKKCVQGNNYLQATITTENLELDKKENIDEDASVDILCKEADRLSIPKLEGMKGWVDLHSIKQIYPIMNIMKKSGAIYNNHDREIIDFLDSEIGKNWIISIDSITKLSPYTSFIGSQSNWFLFEIHVEGKSPSKVSEKIETAFLRQLKRKILNEIDEGQLEPNNPNLIIVQGLEWPLVDFEGHFYDFNKINGVVQTLFQENSFQDLSGVILFSSNFDNARFIENPNSNESSKLNEKDLASLGFSIKI